MTDETEKTNKISLNHIQIERPFYNQNTFTQRYSFRKLKIKSPVYDTKNYLKKNYACSRACLKRYITRRLPILSWGRNYSFKENFFKDLIGGLTIGVVQIPQGMAYSLMAGLPPANGLYATFFSVLIYFLFGTSRHLSMGTYGVVSIMVKAAIEKYEEKLSENHGMKMNSTFFKESKEHVDEKIMIASALALFTGLFHILFAILHVGVVTKYFSDVIVAGFTTGAAYHIVVSQINVLIGVKIEDDSLPFKLIENLICIFKEIKHVNVVTLTISLVSMIILYAVKHFINHDFKEELIAPFPIEFVIIVLGTLFSFSLELNQKFKVNVVGDIPAGFPIPTLPPFNLISLVVFEAFNIAIVSFALNISMAKLFAKKYNYEVHSNQELFAYGLGNVVSSFFKGFPSCVGLSRCIILESTGAKTQAFSLIANVIVLLVILVLGFLFKTLPNCCLASIIVIALIPMIMEVKQIVPIYKRSKNEALAWLVTFGGVIILDTDYGLYIGIVFSILLVVFRSQRVLTFVLGNIPKTDIYEPIELCDDAKEIEGIKILRYEESIYFANCENFIYKIIKFSGVNPNEIISKIKKKKNSYEKKMKSKEKNGNTLSEEANTLKEQLDRDILVLLDEIKIKDIIIDCSSMNLIDAMGAEAILKLNESYNELGIRLHLTHCKRYLLKTFQKMLFNEKFNYEFIYPTTHDAVMSIGYFRQRRISFEQKTIRIQLEQQRHLEISNDSDIEFKQLDESFPTPVYIQNEKKDIFYESVSNKF